MHRKWKEAVCGTRFISWQLTVKLMESVSWEGFSDEVSLFWLSVHWPYNGRDGGDYEAFQSQSDAYQVSGIV